MSEVRYDCDEIPLFPLPSTEDERKRDLQILLYLLTIPGKLSKLKSATVFINVFRLFYTDINDAKLIVAMEKEDRFTPEKNPDSCQDWICNNFPSTLDLSKNPFINADYEITLVGVGILFYAMGNNPNKKWFQETVEELFVKTLDVWDVDPELYTLFNRASLSNVYEALNLYDARPGGYLPPFSLRRFVLTKLLLTHKYSCQSAKTVVGIIMKKLANHYLGPFHAVQRQLIERCPQMHSWIPIAKDVQQFIPIYKKYKSLGEFGPYIAIILSPEEFEPFKKHSFLKLLATATAIGLERGQKIRESYGELKQYQGVMNEARCYYQKCVKTQPCESTPPYYCYDYDGYFKCPEDMVDLKQYSPRQVIPVYKLPIIVNEKVTCGPDLRGHHHLIRPNFPVTIYDHIKAAFRKQVEVEEKKRGKADFSALKLLKMQHFLSACWDLDNKQREVQKTQVKKNKKKSNSNLPEKQSKKNKNKSNSNPEQQNKKNKKKNKKNRKSEEMLPELVQETTQHPSYADIVKKKLPLIRVCPVVLDGFCSKKDKQKGFLKFKKAGFLKKKKSKCF